MKSDMNDIKRDVEDETKNVIEKIKDWREKRLEEFEEFLKETAEVLECLNCTVHCLPKFDTLDGKVTCLELCKCYSVEEEQTSV